MLNMSAKVYKDILKKFPPVYTGLSSWHFCARSNNSFRSVRWYCRCSVNSTQIGITFFASLRTLLHVRIIITQAI